MGLLSNTILYTCWEMRSSEGQKHSVHMRIKFWKVFCLEKTREFWKMQVVQFNTFKWKVIFQKYEDFTFKFSKSTFVQNSINNELGVKYKKDKLTSNQDPLQIQLLDFLPPFQVNYCDQILRKQIWMQLICCQRRCTFI